MVKAQNIHNIKTFSTLELSQFLKTQDYYCTFSSSKPVDAFSNCLAAANLEMPCVQQRIITASSLYFCNFSLRLLLVFFLSCCIHALCFDSIGMMLYWDLIQLMDTYLMSYVADITELDCLWNYRWIAPTAWQCLQNYSSQKMQTTSLWSTVRMYLEVAFHLLVKTVNFSS